mgnify:CR=1 FL=1
MRTVVQKLRYKSNCERSDPESFFSLGSGLVKKSSPTKVGPSTEGRSAGGAGLVDFFTNNGRSDGVSAAEVKNGVLLRPKPVCLFDWVNRGFTSKPKPVL